MGRSLAAVGLVCVAAMVSGACAPLSTALTAGAPRPAFESEDFLVVRAKRGDTPTSLAAEFLGDPARAWMIEDYNGARAFARGQEVVIPKKPWNPSGVYPTGYQLVPVLVYHNIGPQTKGRLTVSARSFEAQMRYLHAEGYRVVSLQAFLEFNDLRRQLPRRSVVLTFDDGYRSFLQHAFPILKELGFTATLFVYTDYVGAGPNALGWNDLKRLADEGVQIEAHSKSHGDLRVASDESSEQYERRMQAELQNPRGALGQRLGRSPQALAYPYGAYDDELVRRVQSSGYRAAFSVHRQGNASFTHPFMLHRSQIYSDMTLEEFARNLDVFRQDRLK